MLVWHGNSGDLYQSIIDADGIRRHEEFHEFKTVREALNIKYQKAKEVVRSYL